MPINNITQTISTLPGAGRRGVDVQTVFVNKQEDFQDHLQGTTVTELNTLKDQLNTRIGEINSTATTMNGYVNDAFAGASTATTKAGEASTSASEASTSRNQAETFKNNASTSATRASQWAENSYNAAVETGKYSAKHWSTVAENATVNKVDKVTSTDNAIVRFDGTTGAVQNSSITVDDNGNIGSGTQSFNGFGGTGFKNYIINGNFDVWQYGKSQTAAGYGSDDRWSNVTNISTKTHSQIYCSNTERALFSASNFSRTVSTYISGTDSLVKKTQYIEDMTRLAGKIVTISFWARADSNKKMNIHMVDFYGTGGAPTNNGTAPVNFGNVDLTSSWTKYKLTGTLPSLIGKTLGTNGVQTSSFRLDFGFTFSPERIEVVNYGMPAGQSGTFDIAQVQLEEGSVATPFEQRPYGLELSLCQRYYEKVDSDRCNTPIYGTGIGFLGSVKYKVPKRTLPTVSLGTASHWRTLVIYNGYPLSTLGVHEITAYGFEVNGTSSQGNIPAGYVGKIQVNDGYTDNVTDGIFVSAEL